MYKRIKIRKDVSRLNLLILKYFLNFKYNSSFNQSVTTKVTANTKYTTKVRRLTSTIDYIIINKTSIFYKIKRKDQYTSTIFKVGELA